MPSKIDPQRIFITAETFLATCRVLQDVKNAGHPGILKVVIATNSAITLEMFLKCLLTLEIGNPCSGCGHDVYKLFKNLSQTTQSELSAEHDKYMADNPNFAAKFTTKGMSVDLESLLKAGRHAFIEFRYAYEKIPAGKNVWGLNAFTTFVRARILKVHPEWEAAFYNPQPTSLFQ